MEATFELFFSLFIFFSFFLFFFVACVCLCVCVLIIAMPVCLYFATEKTCFIGTSCFYPEWSNVQGLGFLIYIHTYIYVCICTWPLHFFPPFLFSCLNDFSRGNCFLLTRFRLVLKTILKATIIGGRCKEKHKKRENKREAERCMVSCGFLLY